MKIVLKEAQLKFLVEKFKIDDNERIKLMETEDFLLVVPLTRTASCKYGAGTKWCVTEKNTDSFDRHFNLGGLGFFIVKNPELQEKLNNDKFAFYVNKPSSEEAARDSGRVIVYDDANNVMPMRSFLNFMDHNDVYGDSKKAIIEFMKYVEQKFDKNNYDLIKKGVDNPF